MPMSTRLMSRRSPACALYQALSEGSALAAAGDRAHEPDGDVVALVPGLDIGFVGHRRARDFRMGRGHALRHGATHAAQRLGRPGIHQALGGSLDVGAGDGAAGAGRLNEVEIDIELARERTHRGKDLQAARARAGSPRLRAPRQGSSPRSISPTTVPVSSCAPSANSTNGAPTLTRSPLAPNRRAMRPLCGEGTSTTALSVSTDTSG